MADHSSSFSFISKRSNAEQEIQASAEEESILQDTPFPPSSSFPIPPDFQPPFVSNSFSLPPNNSPYPQESFPDEEKPTNHTNKPTPMITIDDDLTYQDWPFLTSDPLKPVFHPGVLDPVPFFYPSASNMPFPAASLVPDSFPSVDGEPDSSSGAIFRAVRRQAQQPASQNNNSIVRSTSTSTWANAPPQSCYKLNVAVAVCINRGIQYLGMGAVIRNHEGIVEQALTRLWRSSISPYPDHPEEYIYRVGIGLAAAMGFRRLVAETEKDWVFEQYQDFRRSTLFEYFEPRLISANDNLLANTFARCILLNDNPEWMWSSERIIEIFGSLRLPY